MKPANSNKARLLLCVNKADNPGQLYLINSLSPCRNFYKKIASRKKPPPSTDKNIRYIPLTQGQFAIIDADDYERLKKYKWCAAKSHNGFYAVRYKNWKTIMMHREIMNAPEGLVVDHINGNKLNNRKSNLRICTQAQNIHNSRPRRNRSSKYKGVFWNKESKKWSTAIRKGKVRIYIGGYETEKDAALAYDRKAAELFGEFAYLNFPKKTAEY